jgi:hypothetical protein
VKNYGSHSITAANAMQVAYTFRGGDPVLQNFAGTIPSGDEIQFTFNQTVDVSEYSDDYSLEVYTVLPNDKDAANDTARYHFLYRENVVLYGYVQFDEENFFEARRAVYFNSDNDPSLLTTFSTYGRNVSNLITAGEYLDHSIYAYQLDMSEPADYHFIKLTANWTELSKTSSSDCAVDMAYDYTTGTMFALVNALPSMRLASIDLTTGKANIFAIMKKAFYTLACDLQGTLYGIDEDGDFYSINKTTGALTRIGNTGIIPSSHQSMAFDHHSERLFWTMSRLITDADGREKDEGKLMEIDPATGHATLLGTTGSEAEIVALYTPFTYTDIAYVDGGSTLALYPNPSTGVVHLASVPEKSMISILDLSGRKLESHTNLNGHVTLNLNLAAGIYFIQVESGGKRAVQKLIIKK